jgi:hypothetical protein
MKKGDQVRLLSPVGGGCPSEYGGSYTVPQGDLGTVEGPHECWPTAIWVSFPGYGSTLVYCKNLSTKLYPDRFDYIKTLWD